MANLKRVSNARNSLILISEQTKRRGSNRRVGQLWRWWCRSQVFFTIEVHQNLIDIQILMGYSCFPAWINPPYTTTNLNLHVHPPLWISVPLSPTSFNEVYCLRRIIFQRHVTHFEIAFRSPAQERREGPLKPRLLIQELVSAFNSTRV